jgi:hypothetical protein
LDKQTQANQQDAKQPVVSADTSRKFKRTILKLQRGYSARSQANKTWLHLTFALGFGIAITLIAFISYLLLLRISPATWTISDQFAFGQVYTAFIGLFLTGSLALFVVWEFVDSLQGPRLALAFRFDKGELSDSVIIHTNSGPKEKFSLPVVLYNHGPLVAQMYAVRLVVPFLAWATEPLTSDQKIDRNDDASDSIVPVQIEVGDNRNLVITPQGAEWVVRYFSKGDDVCYPDVPLDMFRLQSVVEKMSGLDSPLECLYHVYSDKSKPTIGTLYVSVY